MKNKKIDLFVPGRLCLLGEHSDWAGKYRNVNNKIEKGYAIVTGIEEGIYATATISDSFIVKFKDDNSKQFKIDMNYEKLKQVAEEGNFWSYVAGVAACVKEQYNIGGIEITITDVTIPTKKGLSSSAAICVLVARAFNELYNLHLNTIGEMNLAYLGEITTPSRCGRLDQACAFGTKPVLMVFDGDRIEVKDIKVGADLHFVFADLMSKKDTIKILGDLNRSFPFAQNELDENVQKALGSSNKEIVLESIKYIEEGKKECLGKMMQKAQKNFDDNVSIACPEELKSPVLHQTIENPFIKENSYGAKGVGSQGDGTIQILAKDEITQKKIKKYLEKELGMSSYTLTIKKTNPIKKAIVPVAGNGTRMYPITKNLRKAFLPIIDKDEIIKPAILCILEELDAAGIEEICLIIDEQDKEYYDKFFKDELSESVVTKLSIEMLEYESKIQKIGRKITYVYQKEKLGLGHAVSLCEKFANNDSVLLVLGDQLYKTNSNKSCTTQFLDNFSKTNKLSVSVCEVPLQEVSKYGILCGKINNQDNYFDVDKMVEKPTVSSAKENYFTICKNEKKYYSVFGEYIITPTVFEILQKNIKDRKIENGEYQLTSALEEAREKDGMIAFIPDGEMLDIGTVEGYRNTFIKKGE